VYNATAAISVIDHFPSTYTGREPLIISGVGFCWTDAFPAIQLSSANHLKKLQALTPTTGLILTSSVTVLLTEAAIGTLFSDVIIDLPTTPGEPRSVDAIPGGPVS